MIKLCFKKSIHKLQQGNFPKYVQQSLLCPYNRTFNGKCHVIISQTVPIWPDLKKALEKNMEQNRNTYTVFR